MSFDLKFNQAKSFFFDAPRITKATNAKGRRGLSKFGSYVRKVARNSIKRGKRTSEPGSPPVAHDGEIKKILFAFQSQSNSVIVGPAKSNQVNFNADGKPTKGTIPSVLEEGGEIQVEEFFNEFAQKWYRRDQRYKRAGGQASRKRRRRKIRIQARPFMLPAFERSKHKLPEYIRNSITKG